MNSVEFVVIHYTATSLTRTLQIFTDPLVKTSAHFVIAPDGKVFELLPVLLEEAPVVAHHSGRSKLTLNGDDYTEFNQFALGIELVNLNGNLFDYTDAQYTALGELFELLKESYPALKDPERVVGHEEISGYRGKIDPGLMFDWPRFYQTAYPGRPFSSHGTRLNLSLRDAMAPFVKQALSENPDLAAEDSRWFESLNGILETASAKK